MPDIGPFRGLRYDLDAVEDLSKVLSPPYDVISELQRAELEAASPYNVVRLVLPRDGTGGATTSKYTNARASLEAWVAAGVLRRDPEPAIYVYEMEWNGRPTRGILAAVSLDEEHGVLPHERTYDEIVGDRLELLRATETNLDTIFCVYEGEDAGAAEAIDRAADAPPVASCTTPDGIRHSVWMLTDPAAVETIARAFEKTPVVIADGHHRWRTATRYRDERRAAHGDGAWDAQMMFLVDATRFGPSLLPIHRVVDGVGAQDALSKLRPHFDVEQIPLDDPQSVADELAARRATGRVFAMSDGASAWLLTVSDRAAEHAALPADRSAAWRDLDVAVLHHLVFDRLLDGVTPRFVHSAREAVDEVRDGRARLAFLLAPMPFEAVRAVAEAGEAMPQKSTFFVPKPATGVVARPLDRP